MTSDPEELTANPFAGPRPLARGEAERLIGREDLVRETALLALAQRIVIVHGASGVGKTSLMQAGVIPDLEERGATLLPSFEVDGMAARTLGGEPAGAYWQRYLDQHLPATDGVAEDDVPDEDLSDESLAESERRSLSAVEVVAWAFAHQRRRALTETSEATRVLVLDQLQELFLDRTPAAEAERATFSSALTRIMADDRRLHLVLVVDDAYLSAARALAARMQLTTPPALINVPPFMQEQAREVVSQTAALGDASIDVEGVVRAAAEATRASDAEETDDTRLVDPILLQTVAWQAVEAASRDEQEGATQGRSRWRAPIDLLRGRRAGGDDAAGPLRELYGAAVARADAAGDWNEQRIRRWSLDTLVSPLGTRALVPLPDEAAPEAPVVAAFEAEAFLERVSDSAGPAVRLAHDRLVLELAASNRGYFALRPLVLILRRAAVAAVLLLAGVLVLGGLSGYQRIQIEDLERQLKETPTPTLTSTPPPTETAPPTPIVPVVRDATCHPTEAYAGERVQCSAGYSGEAKLAEWRDRDGSLPGGLAPLLPPQPVGSQELTFVVCLTNDGPCASSVPVPVEVHSRLGFSPTSVELVTSAELELVNEAPRPTVWSLEAPSWVEAEPSSGTLGRDESVTVTLSLGASTPADGADGSITFEAGPAMDAFVDAGVVSVSASPHSPPQLFLPGNMLFTESEPGAGFLVEYTARATDTVDGNIPVTCVPRSGTVFPVGSALVVCRAVNSWDQSAEGSFGVVVLEAPSPPGTTATCALLIDGVLQKTTCTEVVQFWESRGLPELADPYRAAAAAEAEAAAGS